MMSITVLIVLPYLAFVFISESFNPFSKPKAYSQRATWKYAKAIALAVFAGVACSVTLVNFVEHSLPISAFYGALVSLVLAVWFSARKLSELLRS